MTVERPVIEVPTPAGGWGDPWPNVAEIEAVLPHEYWTLVGGPMVQLHAFTHGIDTIRPTNDVVAIKGGTQALRRTVNATLNIDQDRVSTVSVPDTFGALILKTVAHRADSRDPERHLPDAVVLLACVDDLLCPARTRIIWKRPQTPPLLEATSCGPPPPSMALVDGGTARRGARGAGRPRQGRPGWMNRSEEARARKHILSTLG